MIAKCTIMPTKSLSFKQKQSIRVSKLLFKSVSWMMGISMFIFFTSCSNDAKELKALKNMGPQPTVDSIYIVKYLSTTPKFKEQTDWAKKFYKERDFKLGWFKDHQLVPQAEEMLNVIKKSAEEGLDPKDYQIKDFDKLFAELKASIKDSSKYITMEKEIDMSLSATYFVWASDYYRGVVVPKENKEIEWDVKRNKIKLHKALLTVLGERESKYSYADFKPLHEDYSRLKIALANYRKIQAAGGWPVIPSGTKIKPGQNSPTVDILYKRLLGSTAKADTGVHTVYDENLVSAVKQFQAQNGLKADGSLGPETIKFLNISVDSRIKQIILNMERWRWIPKSFEPDYLLVNIPEFKLHVFEKGQEKFDMRVIVGKTLNSTPIFSDKMEYVVLSPYWNVPMSIITKELAPKLASDPNYLDHLDMEVVTNKGAQVDPSSIDWSSVNEKNFKYILRRRPGPKNDLGDVKFIFPNSQDIYLHDTPHDELFSQAKRGFSHGCVRVEKPIDLAEYLLRNVPGYDRSNIMNTISLRKEKHVSLKQVLPVYLVYFTAWTDKSGQVHFRDDIYGHDKTLAQQYFN
ncbi:L,D-transpeptidase family protein [Daejeonella oryzae]|uniref:L,D-transpeptidase family protein n=1 Tax=Daejeonella oryzae TaxID=1122943 RepID=UPI001C657858|nr:L,D-transpeptidase family protein [Daejeonella oryzae]